MNECATPRAPPCAGEEFRDDTRALMQAATGKVRKLLPPEELTELTHRTLAERGALAGAEVRKPAATFGRIFADPVSARPAPQHG